MAKPKPIVKDGEAFCSSYDCPHFQFIEGLALLRCTFEGTNIPAMSGIRCYHWYRLECQRLRGGRSATDSEGGGE